ncbi:MAG: GPW/gp25 family protein [Thermodesulfobacteriota bacterium]
MVNLNFSSLPVPRLFLLTRLPKKDVWELINQILTTTLGERVMQPNFGCGMNNLVFTPLNPTTIKTNLPHPKPHLTCYIPVNADA